MKYYLFNQTKDRHVFVLLGDIVVLFLAIIVSYTIRIYINNDWYVSFSLLREKLTPWLILVAVPHLFTLYLTGQYDLNRVVNRFRSHIFIVLSVLLAGLLIGTIFFFFPKYIFGRQVLLIHLLISSVFLVGWRALFNDIAADRDIAKRMAVISSYEKINVYSKEILEMTGGKVVLSSVCLVEDRAENSELGGVAVYNDIAALLAADNFDILIYDPLCRIFGNKEIQNILEKKYHGKIVFDLPSFYKNLSGKIPLRYIDGNWLLQREGLQGYVSKPYVYMKRLLDLIMACSLLLLSLPLWIVIAAAVKMDSRGPVIFSQERMGKHRVPFNCLKFRTMVQNAERKSGPVWSSENDPRITRSGRFLRKTRLDELPQLINIIRGDLSFVGPRPIRKHFADKLGTQIPYYDIRFSVQPGLSGWAQVNLDYAGSEQGQHEKFEYELFYIQNMSFFLDVVTIIKTVRSVFRGEGT